MKKNSLKQQIEKDLGRRFLLSISGAIQEVEFVDVSKTGQFVKLKPANQEKIWVRWTTIEILDRIEHEPWHEGVIADARDKIRDLTTDNKNLAKTIKQLHSKVDTLTAMNSRLYGHSFAEYSKMLVSYLMGQRNVSDLPKQTQDLYLAWENLIESIQNPT